MYINTQNAIPKNNISSSETRAISLKLEATFIAEMLKTLEPKEDGSSFGGGIGEEQFQSFLLEQRASAIVAKGGFGLADYFQKSLEKE